MRCMLHVQTITNTLRYMRVWNGHLIVNFELLQLMTVSNRYSTITDGARPVFIDVFCVYTLICFIKLNNNCTGGKQIESSSLVIVIVAWQMTALCVGSTD